MDIPGGATLVRLGETDLMVTDPDQDVRGRKVVDTDGHEIGTVEDLLIDDTEQKVRMIGVRHGGFLGIGATHYLIPVDAVRSVTPEEVRIDRGRSRLSDAPGYDPHLERYPADFHDLYGWWGYPPYW